MMPDDWDPMKPFGGAKERRTGNPWKPSFRGTVAQMKREREEKDRQRNPKQWIESSADIRKRYRSEEEKRERERVMAGGYNIITDADREWVKMQLRIDGHYAIVHRFIGMAQSESVYRMRPGPYNRVVAANVRTWRTVDPDDPNLTVSWIRGQIDVLKEVLTAQKNYEHDTHDLELNDIDDMEEQFDFDEEIMAHQAHQRRAVLDVMVAQDDIDWDEDVSE